MELKFYVCEHCGNIITYVRNSGVPVMCCGQKMTELVPGTSDGAVEKHVPAVETDGRAVTVKVGEVEHPIIFSGLPWRQKKEYRLSILHRR